jgi:hypothetical protein
MNILKSERKYNSSRRNNLTRGYNSDKIVLHGKTKINDEEILACFIHNDENVLLIQ